MLKTLQIFKIERYNAFNQKINKIVLSSNDDKRIQSIGSIETYAYRTTKNLTNEKKRLILQSRFPKLLRIRDESTKLPRLFRIEFTLVCYNLFWIGVKVR